MLDIIKYVLFGISFGAANSIPGVSGGTIAVILNFYDRLVSCITLNFKKIFANLDFLVPLGIGVVVGMIGVAKLMGVFLAKFPSQTYFAFIGVVVGSIPLILYNARKHGELKFGSYIPFIMAFALMMVFAFGNKDVSSTVYTSLDPKTFALIFVSMTLGTMSMVVPGVSGSLVLTMLGMYQTIFVEAIGNFNIPLLIPVGFGGVAGLLGGAKLISFFLEKFPGGTYMAILGLLVGSIVQLFNNSMIINADFITILTSVIAMIVMMVIVLLFSKDEMKKGA